MSKTQVASAPCSLREGGLLHVDFIKANITWECRTDSAETGLLKQLFAKYATPAVEYIVEGLDAGELVQKLKLTIPVTNLNLITQLCHLLDTLLLESGHFTDPNVSPCFLMLYGLPSESSCSQYTPWQVCRQMMKSGSNMSPLHERLESRITSMLTHPRLLLLICDNRLVSATTAA